MDTASQIACERDGGLASCPAIPAVGLPMSPMRSSARGGDGFGRFKLQRAWLTTRRIQWARQHVVCADDWTVRVRALCARSARLPNYPALTCACDDLQLAWRCWHSRHVLVEERKACPRLSTLYRTYTTFRSMHVAVVAPDVQNSTARQPLVSQYYTRVPRPYARERRRGVWVECQGLELVMRAPHQRQVGSTMGGPVSAFYLGSHAVVGGLPSNIQAFRRVQRVYRPT